MKSRFPSVLQAVVLALLVMGAVLAPGCTGEKGQSQPPASLLTVTARRPVTPVLTTPGPVLTGTASTPTPPAATLAATPAWVPGTVVQEGSAILIEGDVTGYKSPRGNFIDEIRFMVHLAPRAEPVTFEVPNTQIIFTRAGTYQYGVNYLVLSGDLNQNGILEPGEDFLVSIPISPESPQYEIYAGEKFTMAIKNPPQPQVTVTTSAPPVLSTDPMILARAPS
jgi:hypothetical protein